MSRSRFIGVGHVISDRLVPRTTGHFIPPAEPRRYPSSTAQKIRPSLNWFYYHLQTFFPSIMYLMKHLISTICSSHRNDRSQSTAIFTNSFILCELRNLKDRLSLSPLIIINNVFFWRFKYRLNCILSDILCSVFITSYCIVLFV